jgi:hypothetical protein
MPARSFGYLCTGDDKKGDVPWMLDAKRSKVKPPPVPPAV